MTRTQEQALDAIDRARRAIDRARHNQDLLIREAADHGLSHRQIAEYAGVSHQTVGRIIREDTTQ